MISAELPWPSNLLSPNARIHWAEKAKAVKKARGDAKVLVQSAIRSSGVDVSKWEGAKVTVFFYPPDSRRRDTDGMIASHKAAQDGIADALGLDDNFFEVTYQRLFPRLHGAVLVVIEPSNPKRKGNEI